MADQSRLEDLRRRVQKDSASIAFAQLAEEYRRAGQYTESVDVCRAGLALHPGYLSARVTLGRALIELGNLDEARGELETVLKSASENLAAIRGLADIFHKQGALPEALAQYQAALALAKNDPELEQTVADLTRRVAPQKRAEAADALSYDQMRTELARRGPPPTIPVPPAQKPPAPAEPKGLTASPEATAVHQNVAKVEPTPTAPPPDAPEEAPTVIAQAMAETVPEISSERIRAVRTIEALEEWLATIHAARTDQRA